MMLFLPTGCKTWEQEPTHLSERLPRHLTTARAAGRVLMKQPVYVFSAHGSNEWCLCLIHALRARQEVRLGTPARCVGPSPGGVLRRLCSTRAGHPTSAWTLVMSTIPCNKAMLPSMKSSRAILKALPGPVSQILEGFGVPGVCLCWKHADQGRAVAKPVPELAAPWLPWPRYTPPQMLTIFGTG